MKMKNRFFSNSISLRISYVTLALCLLSLFLLVPIFQSIIITTYGCLFGKNETFNVIKYHHIIASKECIFFIFTFFLSLAFYFFPRLAHYSDFDQDQKIHFWTMVFFFIVIFYIHQGWNPNFGDEISLYKNYNSMLITEFLIKRYFTWQFGFAEIITIAFAKSPILVWRFFDSLVMTIIAELIIQITLQQGRRKYAFLPCLLLLLTPFAMINCSGWIMTTTAYVWPLLYFLPYILVSKLILTKKHVPVYLLIVSIIFTVPVTISLQLAPVVSLSSLLFICYELFLEDSHKQKVHYFFVVIFILSICGIVFDITAPGNLIRAKIELRWFPDFDTLPLFSKLKLGVLVSFSYFYSVTELNFIIIPFQLGLLLKFFADKKWRFVVLQILISLFIIFFGYIPFFLGKFISLPLPWLLFKNVFLAGTAHPSLYSNFSINIELTVFIFILLCTVVSIYFAMGKKLKGILFVLIFLAGVCTRFMLSFSPTVYASGPRTAFFMAFSIFFLTIILWQEIDFAKINFSFDKGMVLTAAFLFLLIAASRFVFLPTKQPLSKNVLVPPLEASTNSFSYFIDSENISSHTLLLSGWAYHENDDCDVYIGVADKTFKAEKVHRLDVREAFGLESDTQGFSAAIPFESDLQSYTLYLVNNSKKEIYKKTISISKSNDLDEVSSNAVDVE